MIGVVVDWFSLPAYGRILAEDGRRFFVHRSALGGVHDLDVGQRVQFVSTLTTRGLRAEGVRVCEPAAPATPP